MSLENSHRSWIFFFFDVCFLLDRVQCLKTHMNTSDTKVDQNRLNHNPQKQFCTCPTRWMTLFSMRRKDKKDIVVTQHCVTQMHFPSPGTVSRTSVGCSTHLTSGQPSQDHACHLCIHRTHLWAVRVKSSDWEEQIEFQLGNARSLLPKRQLRDDTLKDAWDTETRSQDQQQQNVKRHPKPLCQQTVIGDSRGMQP